MMISVCVAGCACGLSVNPFKKTSAVYVPLEALATAGEVALMVRFFGRPRFFGAGCVPFFFVVEVSSAGRRVSGRVSKISRESHLPARCAALSAMHLTCSHLRQAGSEHCNIN